MGDNRKSSKLVKLNGIFISLCASWASINVDFNLPQGRLASLVDKITLIWSLIIFSTNLIKFLTFQEFNPTNQQHLFLAHWMPSVSLSKPSESGGRLDAKQQEQDDAQISSSSYNQAIFCHLLGLKGLMTLDYLPCINNFGKLYYGLVSVSVGCPLFWRLYLNYYRPLMKNLSLTSAAGGHNIDINSNVCVAKQKLVKFFIDGPKEFDAGDATGSAGGTGKQVAGRKLDADGCFKLNLGPRLDASTCNGLKFKARGCYPLSALHEKRNNATFGLDRPMATDEIHQQHTYLGEFYKNPIRAHDFLEETSAKRWHFLLACVHCLTLFMVVVSIPVLYFTITALYAILNNFTLPEELDSNYFGRSLKFYGVCEQSYVLTQSAMLFAFSNIFITLFLADLIYKTIPISHELTELNNLYLMDRMEQLKLDPTTIACDENDESNNLNAHKDASGKIVNYYHMQQLPLRIWAYFDHLEQLDSFVSKYSFVSIITFISGLSFGQSYLKVGDPSLKTGTAAVFVTNFLSFVYLYLISWDVERRSTRLHNTILSIVARESDHATKRIWQKILFGFYEFDNKRTFTLNNQYPLNLESLFKIMFALITMSCIMNRLYWDSNSIDKNNPNTLN